MKLGTERVRPAIRRTRQRLFRLGLPYADATPLLAARLEVRRRARRQAFALVFAAIVAHGIVRSHLPDPGGTWLVVADALTAALMLLAAFWAVVGPLRTERRLAAGLTARAAHPVAFRARDIVGRWHLAAAALAYGAALQVSIAIWLAGPPEMRVVALLSAVTIEGCAVLLVAGVLHAWARWVLGGYIVAVVLLTLYAERGEPMPGTSVPNEALVMAP
jgi:hypothetical protein